jgi:hypothetical protein
MNQNLRIIIGSILNSNFRFQIINDHDSDSLIMMTPLILSFRLTVDHERHVDAVYPNDLGVGEEGELGLRGGSGSVVFGSVGIPEDSKLKL